MNRSAQPFPSGARTKDGDESIPSQGISSKEGVADVLRPVVVVDGQAGGDVLAEGSKSASATLGGSAPTLRSACFARRRALSTPPADPLVFGVKIFSLSTAHLSPSNNASCQRLASAAVTPELRAIRSMGSPRITRTVASILRATVILGFPEEPAPLIMRAFPIPSMPVSKNGYSARTVSRPDLIPKVGLPGHLKNASPGGRSNPRSKCSQDPPRRIYRGYSAS